MQEHERNSVRSPRTLVDEVDALAVDLGRKLVEAVDLCFLYPPIIALSPIVGERVHRGIVGPILPSRPRQLIWPLCLIQAAVKVMEHTVSEMWALNGTIGATCASAICGRASRPSVRKLSRRPSRIDALLLGQTTAADGPADGSASCFIPFVFACRPPLS